MGKRHSEVERQAIVNRFLIDNESVADIVTETGIARSTIYGWISQSREIKAPKNIELTVKDYRKLESRVKRLESIIEVIKESGCSPSNTLDVKLPAMELLQGRYSIHLLCDALDVPRGTFYNYVFRGKHTHTWYAERREMMKVRIQEIYDEYNQVFGAAKIRAIMVSEGHRISVEMVRRLMRDMGLISIRQDAKDLYEKEKALFPNRVKQNFNASAPNQVWLSDVTFFRYKNFQYYICAIIDVYARFIVGYKIGKRNSTQLIKATFKCAYEKRLPPKGILFHTDRGVNYTSNAFQAYLKAVGVVQSFSRPYTPYDNSVMETFFSSMKREELYRTKYRSEKEFKAAVEKYILFYNEKRPHAKNGYKTPAKKEEEFYSN